VSVAIMRITGPLLALLWVLLPPALPSSFYGIVTIGSEDLPDTALVAAYVNGVQCGQGPVFENAEQTWYQVDCLADDPETLGFEGGRAGDTVSFLVRNETRVRLVTQTAIWRGGGSDRLDLRAIPTGVYLLSFTARVWPW
jgi:hypothetical protein